MTPLIPIDPAPVEGYVLELAQHGACRETGVCRPAYTPEWAAAQQTVSRWCTDAGLETWQDAVGNVWGRLEGTGSGPVVATGSHIDSQLPGGRYDGALGIVAGVIALRTLKERFGVPKRSIDVVSFAVEENSRFPNSNFWSSRAVIGAARPEELDTIRDYQGDTMREVLRRAELDPQRLLSAHRDDIDDFLELHVEQGPILEEQGYPVGVVSAITGSMTYTISVGGRADHAGACPMDLRRDPMAAVPALIEGMLATARAMGRPAVTTVGRVLVEPNYSGVVPQQVVLVVNARHTDPVGYAELRAEHDALLSQVTSAHPELDIAWTVGGSGPTPCAPELIRLLEEVAREQGIPALWMASGGGHDAKMMGRACRSAMIFAQSREGRSHAPDEYTAPEHGAAAIQVLASALYRLAY